MRDPLLGIYALSAEWRALADPAIELASAQLKLAWWRDEIERLRRATPVHPISLYLASLPRAAAVDFSPLQRSLEATARQIGGAPLEHGAELEAHAAALWGAPLAVAAQLAAERPRHAAEALHRSVAALATAEYLKDAIDSYRRDARFGRVVFPVDGLLAANVENADLTAAEPPVHLQSYLDELRGRACVLFEQVSAALPPAEREALRHLLVLAALDGRNLRSRRSEGRPAGGGLFGLRDLYLAWSTSRRAVRH
jgi:phytoene synthase